MSNTLPISNIILIYKTDIDTEITLFAVLRKKTKVDSNIMDDVTINSRRDGILMRMREGEIKVLVLKKRRKPIYSVFICIIIIGS